MFRKKGFTLAEVLITLGIIGMIAEMTIPTLMNNVGNQVFKVGLKKSYSVLSQATVDVMNENSGTMVGVSTTGNNGLRDAYAPFLNFSVASAVILNPFKLNEDNHKRLLYN